MDVKAKENFTIICACCEARLTVDSNTGVVLAHEEKQKKLGNFDEMLKDLEKQKQAREDIFAQELNAQKDRTRLLDEKFREALKRADSSGKDEPYINPLELD